MNRFIIILVLLSFACKKSKLIWNSSIPNITSSSSIKCLDINGDGIQDIIMGAGAEEWTKTEQGIIALNGKDGTIIWAAKARNQIVGSAVFLKINADLIPDIIIGGRSAELQALDGKTGQLIWEFYKKPGRLTAHDEGWFNFFNPQITLDQDKDGVNELIICNGGNALIEAGAKYRPAGKILLISGKTGHILAQDITPDARETYISPVCLDCETSNNPQFIFGTGGETEGGNLFLSDLEALKNKNLKSAKKISSSPFKGFIAPPILADFNLDKNLDILVNQAAGTTILLDGRTHQKIWQFSADSSEVYSQPAVGYFVGNDKILDVFVAYSKGKYPDLIQNTYYLINGKTGKVEFKTEVGFFTYSSPLVADIDANGIDEIVFNSINEYQERDQKKPYYVISVLDCTDKTIKNFSQKQYGACFASSPWLGDLDGNGKLDLLYSGSPATVASFPGTTTFVKPVLKLQVHREEFDNISPNKIRWGEYLGKNSKSILNKDR